MHFSRLPFLPEIDALKEDLSIINDTFQHLQISHNEPDKNYIEAYKYTFSRKGKLIFIQHYHFSAIVFIRIKNENRILQRIGQDRLIIIAISHSQN